MMPDFVITMMYKAINTSEQKFQYFIWQEDQANCIFFLMEGISHISGILIFWGIRHIIRLSLSPPKLNQCVCQGDNASPNALVTLEAMNVCSKTIHNL
jgi:hypothetical protein